MRAERASGVSLILSGKPSVCTRPATGCSTSSIICRACVCGSAKTCAKSWIGPAGTPAASMRSTQSAVVRAASAASISRTSAGRFAILAAFVSKRGSVASASRSSVAQSCCHCCA